MSRLHALFVVLGTFFPILWMAAVAWAAYVAESYRWRILTILPLVGAAIAWLIAEPVGRDGNLLAAVVYMVSALLLGVYYIGLIAVSVGSKLSRSSP